MNILGRLFGNSGGANPAIPRGTCVFHSKKGILVPTTHWDTTRWCGYGDPIALFPNEVDETLLGEHVLQCIRSSRAGLTQQELARSTAGMFRIAGVSGWEALEAEWNLIQTSIEQNDESIRISPMRRGAKGGFVCFDGDPFVRCRPESKAVGQALLEVLFGRCLPFAGCLDDGVGPGTSHLSNERRDPSDSRQIGVGLRVGDRVADLFGNLGIITWIDPDAEHGMGVIRIQTDDGEERTYSSIASGLEPV